MPRVPDYWLDSIIYLYPSVEDARNGSRWGGTGFIIGVPCEDARIPLSIAHLYFVTNDHVRTKAGAVRFNLHGGGFDVKSVTPDSWTVHPDGDDLAVRKIVQHPGHRQASVNWEMLLTPEAQGKYDFGPGDDAFFMGRYINHAGVTLNEPVVREGIISGLPTEPIDQRPERDHDQESILVEARSHPGFSGSPVFVTRTAVIEPERDYGGVPHVVPVDDQPIYLLGVDWGFHPRPERVMSAKTGVKVGSLVAETLSGLMMVVPAEKLRSLLMDHPKLVKQRRKAEAEFIAKNEAMLAGGVEISPGAARLSSAEAPRDGEAPNEQWDNFENLTRKLVNTPKPGSDT